MGSWVMGLAAWSVKPMGSAGSCMGEGMDEVPVESPLSSLVSRCQAHRPALVQVATAAWSWQALHATSSLHWQPLASVETGTPTADSEQLGRRLDWGHGIEGGAEGCGVRREGEWIPYQTAAVTLLCLASPPWCAAGSCGWR